MCVRTPLISIFAAAALLGVATACSGGRGADPETAPASTRVPATTIRATTTSTSTSTSTSTTTNTSSSTTTIPVLYKAVLADVTVAAELGPLPEETDVQQARRDLSPLYDNGCHVDWGATEPSQLPCEFGDTTSDIVIVITGDSHVAAWFGAFDEAGKANDWKIVTVTKRGCPAADVRVYAAISGQRDTPYRTCNTWRENAIEYINELQPDLVVFPMLTRRSVVGRSGASAIREWGEGLGRTLDAIGASGAKLLVIGDTPKSNGDDIPGCVSSHRRNIKHCGNSRERAIFEDRLAVLAEAAPAHHATYVDPSNWFCTETFCPAVIGNLVVYRDTSHLTDSFARYRAPQIAQAIRVALASNP